MPAKELKVMCGIPGSGKSTWIKTQGVTEGIVSRDVIRMSLISEEAEYFSRETEVFDKFVKQINDLLNSDIDVIYVDATHISRPSRAKLLGRLRPARETILSFEVFDVELGTCLTRNAMRTGRARVPDSAIRNMYKSFRPPTPQEFTNYKYGFKEIRINYH